MGLSIGDVEKITGISKDRLRYYEEKQLIAPVRDLDNSYMTFRGYIIPILKTGTKNWDTKQS